MDGENTSQKIMIEANVNYGKDSKSYRLPWPNDEVRDAVRRKANENGKTVKAYLLGLIKEDLAA